LNGNFNLLAGNDEVSLAYNAQGCVGCVSVESNITPKLCKALQDNWQNGNFKTSLQKLLPLYLVPCFPASLEAGHIKALFLVAKQLIQ